MFLSVYAYDSPCVLHPPMASKDGVYRYLKFAVLTIHFTSKVGKSMWDPIYLIIFNLDYMYSVVVRLVTDHYRLVKSITFCTIADMGIKRLRRIKFLIISFV